MAATTSVKKFIESSIRKLVKMWQTYLEREGDSMKLKYYSIKFNFNIK